MRSEVRSLQSEVINFNLKKWFDWPPSVHKCKTDWSESRSFHLGPIVSTIWLGTNHRNTRPIDSWIHSDMVRPRGVLRWSPMKWERWFWKHTLILVKERARFRLLKRRSCRERGKGMRNRQRALLLPRLHFCALYLLGSSGKEKIVSQISFSHYPSSSHALLPSSKKLLIFHGS